MNRSVKAWHVLLVGPVVEFLVGLATLVGSPTAQDAGVVDNQEALGVAFHGFVTMVAAVGVGVAALVPLVLLALGRLRRVGSVLSAGLAVVFGVVPPEPHPATVAGAAIFAVAAVLAWREAGADDSPAEGR